MEISSAEMLIQAAQTQNPIRAKAMICQWAVETNDPSQRETILSELSNGDPFAQDLAVIAYQRLQNSMKIVELLLKSPSRLVQKHATRALVMSNPHPEIISKLLPELSQRILSDLLHYLILKKKRAIIQAILPLLVKDFHWAQAGTLFNYLNETMAKEYFPLLNEYIINPAEVYSQHASVILDYIKARLNQYAPQNQRTLIETHLHQIIGLYLRYSPMNTEYTDFYNSRIVGTSLAQNSPLYTQLRSQDAQEKYPEFFPEIGAQSELIPTYERFHEFFNSSGYGNFWTSPTNVSLNYKKTIYRYAVLDQKADQYTLYANDLPTKFAVFDALSPKLAMIWDAKYLQIALHSEFDRDFSEYELNHHNLDRLSPTHVPFCFTHKYFDQLYVYYKQNPNLEKTIQILNQVTNLVSLNVLWDDIIAQTHDLDENVRIAAYRKLISLFVKEAYAESQRREVIKELGYEPTSPFYSAIFENEAAAYVQLDKILQVFLSAKTDEKNVRFQNLISLQSLPKQYLSESHFPILKQIIADAMENAETSMGRQDQLRALIVLYIQDGSKRNPNVYNFGLELFDIYKDTLLTHPNFWNRYPLYRVEPYEFIKPYLFPVIQACMVDKVVTNPSKFESLMLRLQSYWETDPQLHDWVEQYVMQSDLKSPVFIQQYLLMGYNEGMRLQKRTNMIKKMEKLLTLNLDYILYSSFNQYALSLKNDLVDTLFASKKGALVLKIINAVPRLIKFLSMNNKTRIFNSLLKQRTPSLAFDSLEEYQRLTKLILSFPLLGKNLTVLWNPRKCSDITTFNYNLSALTIGDYFDPTLIELCLTKLESMDPAYFPTALNALLKISNQLPRSQRDQLLIGLIPTFLNLSLKNLPLSYSDLKLDSQYSLLSPTPSHTSLEKDYEQSLDSLVNSYKTPQNITDFHVNLEFSNLTPTNQSVFRDHAFLLLKMHESPITFGFMNQLLDLLYPTELSRLVLHNRYADVYFFPNYEPFIQSLLNKIFPSDGEIGEKNVLLDEYASLIYLPPISKFFLLPHQKELLLPYVNCNNSRILSNIQNYLEAGWFLGLEDQIFTQILPKVIEKDLAFSLRLKYLDFLLVFNKYPQFNPQVFTQLEKLLVHEADRLTTLPISAQVLFPTDSELKTIVTRIFDHYTYHNHQFHNTEMKRKLYSQIKQTPILINQFDYDFRLKYEFEIERSAAQFDRFIQDALKNHPDFPYFEHYLISRLCTLLPGYYYYSTDIFNTWIISKLENYAQGQESDQILYFTLRFIYQISFNSYTQDKEWYPYLKVLDAKGTPFIKYLINQINGYQEYLEREFTT